MYTNTEKAKESSAGSLSFQKKHKSPGLQIFSLQKGLKGHSEMQ